MSDPFARWPLAQPLSPCRRCKLGKRWVTMASGETRIMCVPCMLDVTPPGSLGSSPSTSSGSPALIHARRALQRTSRELLTYDDAASATESSSDRTIEDEQTKRDREVAAAAAAAAIFIGTAGAPVQRTRSSPLPVPRRATRP